MVEAGWCRKQATDLSAYTVVAAHYLAALPRKYIGAGHEKCTPKVCIAYNVDEKLYAVAHTSEDCRCQLHEPEIPKVIIQTIKKGGIPLISISLTPEGDPRLRVLDASPDVHVWIGGLGNFSQSQLPRCQLLSIHSLLKSLKSYKPKHRDFSNPVSKSENWFFAKRSRIFTVLNIITSFLICFHRRRKPQSSDLELTSIQDKAAVIFWMDTFACR